MVNYSANMLSSRQAKKIIKDKLFFKCPAQTGSDVVLFFNEHTLL